MSGPNPLGVLGRRVGRAFLGQLVSGSFPFEALGSGRLAKGVGLGPKVPTLVTRNRSIVILDRSAETLKKRAYRMKQKCRNIRQEYRNTKQTCLSHETEVS